MEELGSCELLEFEFTPRSDEFQRIIEVFPKDFWRVWNWWVRFENEQGILRDFEWFGRRVGVL